jgi:hypothetical protein
VQTTACIWCACGAKYERVEVRLPIKDVGIYECQCCSAEIERWQGRDVPSFKLIARPETKSASAA